MARMWVHTLLRGAGRVLDLNVPIRADIDPICHGAEALCGNPSLAPWRCLWRDVQRPRQLSREVSAVSSSSIPTGTITPGSRPSVGERRSTMHANKALMRVIELHDEENYGEPVHVLHPHRVA